LPLISDEDTHNTPHHDLDWDVSLSTCMLTLMSIEHELLDSLDFNDTIKEIALAKTRKTAI